jgi:hypothetical protein
MMVASDVHIYCQPMHQGRFFFKSRFCDPDDRPADGDTIPKTNYQATTDTVKRICGPETEGIIADTFRIY